YAAGQLQRRAAEEVRAGPTDAQGEVVLDAQGPFDDVGRALVAVGAREDQRAGAVLVDAADAAEHAGQGQQAAGLGVDRRRRDHRQIDRPGPGVAAADADQPGNDVAAGAADAFVDGERL